MYLVHINIFNYLNLNNIMTHLNYFEKKNPYTLLYIKETNIYYPYILQVLFVNEETLGMQIIEKIDYKQK